MSRPMFACVQWITVLKHSGRLDLMYSCLEFHTCHTHMAVVYSGQVKSRIKDVSLILEGRAEANSNSSPFKWTNCATCHNFFLRFGRNFPISAKWIGLFSRIVFCQKWSSGRLACDVLNPQESRNKQKTIAWWVAAQLITDFQEYCIELFLVFKSHFFQAIIARPVASLGYFSRIHNFPRKWHLFSTWFCSANVVRFRCSVQYWDASLLGRRPPHGVSTWVPIGSGSYPGPRRPSRTMTSEIRHFRGNWSEGAVGSVAAAVAPSLTVGLLMERFGAALENWSSSCLWMVWKFYLLSLLGRSHWIHQCCCIWKPNWNRHNETNTVSQVIEKRQNFRFAPRCHKYVVWANTSWFGLVMLHWSTLFSAQSD